MSVIVRYAPSPTGYIHVGNAITALRNFLFAKKAGGKFMLRMDDTDIARSKREFETAIIEDFDWLGMPRDIFARQIERADAHHAAMEKLKAAGFLYPCYETAAELDRKRKRQEAMRKAPVYDRAALKLTDEDRAKLEAEGRKPHWRFKLSGKKVTWDDLVRGPVEIDTASQSDPVLIREDGTFLYTLPSVVDDIDFAITHVVRGEDHVTNTAAQIELFQALGAKPPVFGHFPLMVGVGGEALSKRLGSLSLRDLRAEGIEPIVLNSYLARIGTSDPVVLRTSMDELIAEFDIGKIGRAPAHFDPVELAALNAKYLQSAPYEKMKDKLAALDADGGADFWDAVRANLNNLSDAPHYLKMIKGPITPITENEVLLAAAAKLLPPEPWDQATWGAWTAAVGSAMGVKGRGLFHPLRLALTGSEHGPELKKLLPLIGRTKAVARLQGVTA
jgi:glutamyl-tRNA synthetase